LKGEKISLSVKPVAGAKIRWYQIVPDINTIYKNANHPWEKNPYKWVGLAKITYNKKELKRFRGRWEIQPFETPKGPKTEKGLLSYLRKLFKGRGTTTYYNNRVGSFWFQVELEKGSKILRSAGIEDSDKRGLSPKVLRVSVRDGPGYLGYLTSFYNVPGIFGSIPYQCHHYIGADCADVLMAAYGKWKGKEITKDYCVAHLVDKFPKAARFDLSDGKPDRTVSWGKQVRPGDLIAVKYPGKSVYQHIGALYRDADKNGLLDPDDLVIHAGPLPLHLSRLREGKFDGHVVVLRMH
jgi:hypothetical protein